MEIAYHVVGVICDSNGQFTTADVSSAKVFLNSDDAEQYALELESTGRYEYISLIETELEDDVDGLFISE